MPAQSNPARRRDADVHARAARQRAERGAGRGGEDGADEGAARARAWVEVDLAAVVRNARRVHAHAGVPLLPMVKADAYGCGAVRVARALDATGLAWAFGVATVAEGAELRAAGLASRVVVFTPLVAGDLARAHAAGLTPSLHRADDVRAWAALGGGPWHLAVDTGMSRAGVRWDALAGDLLAAARAHPPEGAYTHFHSAERDDGSRAEQEGRFRAALAALPERPRVLHAENTPALQRRGASAWDVVRPGLYCYGASCVADAAPPAPAGSLPAPDGAVRLCARVVDVRDVAAGESVSYGATWRAPGARRIATAALGYADGYRRAMSGRGVALVGGGRARVVGAVTMDMTMLDVTGLACEVGDVATFLGSDGRHSLGVDDVARLGGLSPYEVLAGLGARPPRLYRAPAEA